MAEIAQFIVTFVLGYVIARSSGFWMHYGIALFGILAIPVLAVVFMAGSQTALWDALGSSMGILLAGLLAAISSLFQALPVMTAGAALGALIGSGVLR